MIRRSALALAAVLVLAGCATPPTRWAAPVPGRPAASVSPSPGAPAQWRPCPEISPRQVPNVTFDCATIAVPQDWLAPVEGRTFELALVRVRAAGQHDRIGSLVVNPGGPGGSGIELAVGMARWLPVDVARRFDIIGFDPRGVGRSTQVKCFSDAALDASFGYEPDPVSQAEFDGLVALSRQMAQACGDKYGDTLRLFSTEQAARDIDAVRAAVGDQKLTYLGYSYGTLLGAVYAQLYPTNVRALVLDGAVDPTLDGVASTESQTRGFERAFDNFVNWCRTAPNCPIAPDARAAVNSALDGARTNPATGRGGRKATAGWVFTAVVSALYSAESWPRLAAAIATVRAGNPTGVFQLADEYARRDSSGHYTNLFDVLVTVNCTDRTSSPSVEQMRRMQAEWRAKYPMFGANSALNLVCAQWPGKHDPYPTGRADGAPPIVVVGTRGDPATPYEQAPALAGMLGVGTVLTWEGEGHTAYPQTPCVTAAVNAYLVNLAVPAPGASCPAR